MPKIGLLTLSLELYETLAPGMRQGRDAWIRASLVPPLAKLGEVCFSGGVFTREAIDAEVARLESSGCDCLIVVLPTYSPSQLTLPALKRTRMPILIWNTAELFAVDETFDGQKMLDNHGVHGTQDLANVLGRAGVPFQYITSHVNDANGLAGVTDFVLAAAAARRLRDARLALIGYPFPGMGDFAVDTTYLTATLGCQYRQISVEEYITRSAAASAADVRALVAAYRAEYDVAADVTDADLDTTARVELSCRGMVRDYKLSALTYQFTAFGEDERTPTLPFVSASRLMADGVGFGGEGDLISAAGTCVLNWLAAPASFGEIFTIDFAGNSLWMSHMGEANVAMARKDRKVRLLARPAQITRTRGRQLALVTCFEPGPATLFSLTQTGTDNRWTLIASAMDIVDSKPMDFAVPHFKLAPRQDVRDWLTAYAKAGGPHHLAVCFGDATARIAELARILDAKFVKI